MPTSWGLYLVSGQLLVKLPFQIVPCKFLLLISTGGVLYNEYASTVNTWMKTKNYYTESKLHTVNVHFREIH